MTAAAPLLLHAGCVAAEGRGLLILGPAGAGKSALALAMMALGARLVADDQVLLARRGHALVATCPPPLRGLIEARHVGLLRADPLPEAVVQLAVDLGQTETDRLPGHHGIVFLEKRIDLVRGPHCAHLPAALLQYLRGGRAA